MKAGISRDSVAREAVWSTGQGSVDGYPASNLGDLENLRRVFVSASAGFIGLGFVLPAARPIDFLAFIHHSAPAGAVFYLRLSSTTDPNADDVYVSGEEAFWPGGVVNDAYPAVRPFRLPQVYTARSGSLLVYNAPGLELGAIELGRFWEWPDIDVGREIGIKSNASSVPVGSGVTHVTRQWAPRYVSGSRELVDVVEIEQTLLDHQRFNGLWRTFVWAEDIEDPATWPRQCMAVTHDALPAGTRDHEQGGAMAFAFREQLR